VRKILLFVGSGVAGASLSDAVLLGALPSSTSFPTFAPAFEAYYSVS
jgi:hypothetical protein